MANEIYNRPAGLIALAVLCCLVYANALDNPFHYDDYHSIVDNPNLRSLAQVPNFFTDPTLFSANPENAMFRPLLLCSFAINYAISGYQMWSWHAFSLLLHIACVMLVVAIARGILGRSAGAWLAGGLFAVHPINSECINYISSRSEILSSLFLLLAIWFYIRVRKQGREQFSLGELWVSLAFFAALLSKSIAIVLPALLLAYDVILSDKKRSHWPRFFVVMGLITVLYLTAIWRFLAKATVGEPVRPYDEQIWTQVKALVFYIKMLLWPSGQSIDHQFLISDSFFDPIAMASLGFIVSLCFIVFYYRGTQPQWLFFLLWFVLVLSPSALVPLNVLVNEHRLYLPSAAFCMAVGLAFDRLVLLRPAWRPSVSICFGFVLFIFSLATFQRNAVWASSLSLWKSAAEAAPLMARPYIYLGDEQEKRGDYAAAIATYEHALSRDPGFAPLLLRLGRLYMDSGNADRALELFVRGTSAEGESIDLWSARAEAHREIGQWRESLEAYLNALALSEDDDVLHNNIGNTYQVLKRPQEALQHHQRAFDINPLDARTLVNLGNAYGMLNQTPKALTAFFKAVELDVNYAGAWLNLGLAQEKSGDGKSALAAYKRAAALEPSYRSVLDAFVERSGATSGE